MTAFSANLGFLWADRPLPDAIRAAKAAGFDAVEMHWPYDVPSEEIRAALSETGLPVLGLNTRRGDLARGESGLSALPGREDEARAAIDEALAYAAEIGCGAVHVMAGATDHPEARQTFIGNLRYACDNAPDVMMILIEPLNAFDAPGYFLRDTGQAAEILREVGSERVKLMFDAYHVQRTEGDPVERVRRMMPLIGHIQFADAPGRGPPGTGEFDFRGFLDAVAATGWTRPLGAEYRPGTRPTEETLGWMERR